MNIDKYLQKRREVLALHPSFRKMCWQCRQPEAGCYCQHIRPFHLPFEVVILMHPLEFRRRIATGRMAHLCIKNSKLFVGADFENHDGVNGLLDQGGREKFVLYPGANASNLSKMNIEQKKEKFGQMPLIFVLDGTWHTAKKMIARSHGLVNLPQITFDIKAPSEFKVRRQPGRECLSTIEAIDQMVNHLAPALGCLNGVHGNLLEVFNKMVERQVGFKNIGNVNPRGSRHLKAKQRRSIDRISQA